MSVVLFKGAQSEVFDEYTYVDRLKEGWSLEVPTVEAAEVPLTNTGAKGLWVHSELPNDPTDEKVVELAYKAEIPFLAMKNPDTLKKELGYEYQG